MGKNVPVLQVDFEAPRVQHLFSESDLPSRPLELGELLCPITGKTKMLKGPPELPGFNSVPGAGGGGHIPQGWVDTHSGAPLNGMLQTHPQPGPPSAHLAVTPQSPAFIQQASWVPNDLAASVCSSPNEKWQCRPRALPEEIRVSRVLPRWYVLGVRALGSDSSIACLQLGNSVHR